MHNGPLSIKLPVIIITSVAGLFALNATTYADEPPASTLSKPMAAPKSSSQVQLGGTNEDTIHVDLNKVRDWGLNIRQIKQQALSLYMEATRRELSPNDGPDLNVPSTIPNSTSLDYSKCLPPRSEWVAYFLNTIEPLTQFIHVRMKASEAGKITVIVPKGTSTELNPLRAKIHTTIRKLESDLDSLDDIFNGDTISNQQLVEVSREIYDDATSYEELRQRFYEVIRKATKQGVTASEPLPPLSQN
jgi:hypothetical protein